MTKMYSHIGAMLAIAALTVTFGCKKNPEDPKPNPALTLTPSGSYALANNTNTENTYVFKTSTGKKGVLRIEDIGTSLLSGNDFTKGNLQISTKLIE